MHVLLRGTLTYVTCTLSLEMKGDEYISVFFLILQFSNVLYNCESANKLAAVACQDPISTALFLFFISGNCKI